MLVASFIHDPVRAHAVREAAREIGLELTSEDDSGHQDAMVWVVDLVSGPTGPSRLLGRSIPACAWLIALAREDQADVALDWGADDVVAWPSTPAALRCRLSVGARHAEQLLPLWKRPSLFERVPGPVMMLDVAGAITSVNSAFESTLGYTAAEVVGRRPRDLAAPGDESLAELMVGDFAMHNPRRSLTLRLRRADGRPISTRWRISFDLDGETLLAVGMALQGEGVSEAIEPWREAWRTSLVRAGWAAFALDAQGRVLAATSAAEALLGAEPGRAEGMLLADRVATCGAHPWRDSPGELRAGAEEADDTVRPAAPRALRLWSWGLGVFASDEGPERVVVATLSEPAAEASAASTGPQGAPQAITSATWAPAAASAPSMGESSPLDRAVGQLHRMLASTPPDAAGARRALDNLRAALGAPPASDAAAPTLASEAPLVLVLDANEGVRTFIARVARGCGYRVITAADASRATALFSERSHRLAAVFVDWHRGDASAESFLGHLRTAAPELATFLLTAEPDPDSERWRAWGVRGVVHKPLGLPSIRSTLVALRR